MEMPGRTQPTPRPESQERNEGLVAECGAGKGTSTRGHVTPFWGWSPARAGAWWGGPGGRCGSRGTQMLPECQRQGQEGVEEKYASLSPRPPSEPPPGLPLAEATQQGSLGHEVHGDNLPGTEQQGRLRAWRVGPWEGCRQAKIRE